MVRQMDIILSNSSGKPIYEQISDQVKSQILSGTLAEGDALPSMRLLAKGKGCFVAPQNRELLREAQLRRVEEFLSLAVDEARKGGFTLEELTEMLNILYQGE